MKFQNPSMQWFISYGMHQISFGFFSKGHISREGNNSNKKKNTDQLFFHEESIHEISKP